MEPAKLYSPCIGGQIVEERQCWRIFADALRRVGNLHMLIAAVEEHYNSSVMVQGRKVDSLSLLDSLFLPDRNASLFSVGGSRPQWVCFCVAFPTSTNAPSLHTAKPVTLLSVFSRAFAARVSVSIEGKLMQ